MLEIFYVVAIGMSITNIYKKKIWKGLVPFLSFATVIGLNMLNAYIFDPEAMKDAIKDAVMVGGITIGLFNAGDITGKKLMKPKA